MGDRGQEVRSFRQITVMPREDEWLAEESPEDQILA